MHDAGGRLVDTLAQRLVGLPESIALSLRWVFDHYPIYFVGTSGSDLRAGEDYLHLRRGDISQRRLFWVTPPGVPIQPVVASLLEHYRDGRATSALLSGRMPDDLPVDPSLDTDTISAQPPGSAQQGFRQTLTEWGRHLGPLECALLLADFAEHIGLPRIGIDALERVLPSDPYEPVGTAAPLAVRLAELLAGRGDRAASGRAIALLNQAQRSPALPAGDLAVRLARERIFAGGIRFDDAIRELSDPSSTGSEAQMLEAASLKAQCLRRLGRWRESLATYEEVAQDAAQRGYPTLEGRCRLGCGELLGRFGDYERAEQNFSRAAAAFRQVGATRDLAAVPMAQARLALERKNYPAAISLGKEAAEAAGWASDLVAEARAVLLQAESIYKAGDRAAAQTVAQRASQVADESGDPQILAECQNMDFRLHLDDTGEGFHFVPQTPEDAGIASPSERLRFYRFKAQNAERQENFEKAFEWTALAENELTNLDPSEVEVKRLQLTMNFGQLLSHGNNPDSAYQHFTRLRTLADRYDPDDTVGTLQTIANQADALRRGGRSKEALVRYDEGIALAARLPEVDPLTPQMKFCQAEILWRDGSVSQAIAKLISAEADAERTTERPNVTREYIKFMLKVLMNINHGSAFFETMIEGNCTVRWFA